MATPLTPTQLLAVLKAEGLTVVEYTGWRDRCRCHSGSHEKNEGWLGDTAARKWGSVNGTVTHITAGNLGDRSVEQYIADIIDGDKAVPDKAQIVVAPDGRVYLNSAGRSNHAGKVGLAVQNGLIRADFSLTDDYDDRYRGSAVDGNAFTYGIENVAASAMNAAQRASSVKINAAIARHYGWTGQESVGHGEISGERTKADPNLDMGQFRRDVMAVVKAGAKAKPPVIPPPKDVEPPVSSETVTLHGLHWNVAGSDVHNGYGARNATRGPDVGRRALAVGFDVFLACEAGQTNLRSGINTVLGKRQPWYSHAKAIWATDEVKLLAPRKTYADTTFNYLKTVKYGAAIFGEFKGKKFAILEIHTDYRAPARQAAQVKSIFTKFRKDCDALGIRHENQVVTGDLNWDGTSGDDPFTALVAWNFVEKGDRHEATFHTGKHLDGVLAHENADVDVSRRGRADLSDHYALKFAIHFK